MGNWQVSSVDRVRQMEALETESLVFRFVCITRLWDWVGSPIEPTFGPSSICNFQLLRLSS